MLGDIENNDLKGVIPRSMEHIFDKVEKDKEHRYKVFISYIQIYLEIVNSNYYVFNI